MTFMASHFALHGIERNQYVNVRMPSVYASLFEEFKTNAQLGETFDALVMKWRQFFVSISGNEPVARMTKGGMQEELKARGVKGYSGKNKKDLQKMIKKARMPKP